MTNEDVTISEDDIELGNFLTSSIHLLNSPFLIAKNLREKMAEMGYVKVTEFKVDVPFEKKNSYDGDFIERVFDDLHEEFLKASVNLDVTHNGPVKTADQRTTLIRVYADSIEKILKEGYR